MNMIDTLKVMIGVALAFVASNTVAHHWGWASGALAFAVVALGWLAFLWLMPDVLEVWYARFPIRPTCRNGVCGSYDYEYLGRHGNAYAWRCRCGLEYREIGSVFHEVDVGGNLQPYRCKHWLRWRPCRTEGNG